MTERKTNAITDLFVAITLVLTTLSTTISITTAITANNQAEELLNDVSNLRAEIHFSEKSQGENFEKRLQWLADRINEIDKEFEEVKHHDIDAPTVIFAEEIPRSGESEYSKERLPENVDTNRYDCEPHTFGSGTHQYWLQSACYTDEKGLRYFLHNSKKYYCVAMGGAYGTDIGDIWDVTLECGSTFGIILSDYQHSIDPPDPNDFGEIYERDIYGNVVDILRNYDGEPVCHVLEFVVEIDKLNPYILEAGTVSAIKEFGGLYGDGGNIVDISYIGRAWSL